MEPLNTAVCLAIAGMELVVAGESEDEVTFYINQDIFNEVYLVPQLLNDITNRMQEIELFGEELSSPLIIALTGLNGLF